MFLKKKSKVDSAMEFENVKPQDLDKIYQIENRVFGDDSFSRDLIKKLIFRNLIFLKLISSKKKGEILGFVIVIKDKRDRANIINFLINPSYHSKGYGSALLQKTIEIIKNKEEISRIVLNVKTYNEKAIYLYKKYGFFIKKRIDEYYQSGDSSYKMQLELP